MRARTATLSAAVVRGSSTSSCRAEDGGTMVASSCDGGDGGARGVSIRAGYLAMISARISDDLRSSRPPIENICASSAEQRAGAAWNTSTMHEFEVACEYVREVGLESKEQWVEWCRDGHRPDTIPSASHVTRTRARGGCRIRTGWATARGALLRGTKPEVLNARSRLAAAPVLQDWKRCSFLRSAASPFLDGRIASLVTCLTRRIDKVHIAQPPSTCTGVWL